jgi:hypothetical protein
MRWLNYVPIAKEEFGDWNLQTAVLQAAERAKQYRMECLENGTSMVVETVLLDMALGKAINLMAPEKIEC